MKTNSLRKLIKGILSEVAPTSYARAPDSQKYPYIVYELATVNMGDMNREDSRLEVHVWTRDDPAAAEELADQVEEKLHDKNLPQEDILPTIYKESRMAAEDEDKRISHIVIIFEVQTYRR